jgi:hypothetical protein
MWSRYKALTRLHTHAYLLRADDRSHSKSRHPTVPLIHCPSIYLESGYHRTGHSISEAHVTIITSPKNLFLDSLFLKFLPAPETIGSSITSVTFTLTFHHLNICATPPPSAPASASAVDSFTDSYAFGFLRRCIFHYFILFLFRA